MPKKTNRCNDINDANLIDSDQDDFQIPNICKFIRRVFKATQKQMAKKLSVNLSTYRDWEYGKYVPKGFPAINLGLLYLYAKDRETIKTDFPKKTMSDQ